MFVGLALEKNSEKPWYVDIRDRKRQKLKGEIGWWILMVGIFVEIAIAGWHTVGDAIELNRIKRNAETINPINQPVSSLSALVRIKVAGEQFPSQRLFGIPPSTNCVAWLMLCDSNINSSFNLNALKADNYIADSGNPRPGSGYREYFLEFREIPHGAALLAEAGHTRTVNSIRDVAFLQLSGWFLPRDFAIIDGSATVIINSTLRKRFFFPPQHDISPFIYTVTNGFVIIATNSFPGKFDQEQ